MNAIIRPYQPATDLQAVFALYQDAFAESWPLTLPLFEGVTSAHVHYRPGDHFVAELDGRIAGFAATQMERGLPLAGVDGGIAVIFVAESVRRQGIGKALHAVALDHLQACNCGHAILGGGGLFRLWPGVPETQRETLGFFQKQGWPDFERCFDMVRSLADYEMPDSIRKRMQEQRIEIRPAREAEVQAVLEFEMGEFANWYDEFYFKVELGALEDILVAVEDGKILGTLSLFTPRTPYLAVQRVWQTLLGANVGGLGAVGVAEAQRGRDIGIALVAYASEILKSRGVGNSVIDWTNLDSFYGRVGYQIWREYWVSFRGLG
jgi:GNAT superfamily N-acetyltransferase